MQRRHRSSEHDNPGRVSKVGDQEVRTTLHAAANADDGEFSNQDLGHAPHARQGTPPVGRGRRPQARGPVASHVSRRHRLQ